MLLVVKTWGSNSGYIDVAESQCALLEVSGDELAMWLEIMDRMAKTSQETGRACALTFTDWAIDAYALVPTKISDDLERAEDLGDGEVIVLESRADTQEADPLDLAYCELRIDHDSVQCAFQTHHGEIEEHTVSIYRERLEVLLQMAREEERRLTCKNP